MLNPNQNERWTYQDYLDMLQPGEEPPIAFDPYPEFGQDAIPHDSRDFSLRSSVSPLGTILVSYDYDIC